jgi:hypothetical protein
MELQFISNIYGINLLKSILSRFSVHILKAVLQGMHMIPLNIFVAAIPGLFPGAKNP